MIRGPILPRAARLLHRARDVRVLLHQIRPLNNIDDEPLTDMPAKVAMQRPHTRIIVVQLHDQVPARPQELSVPALRVLRAHDRRAVPRPDALVEHVEVLAVDVHRVREGNAVVEDEPDRAVGAEVVDVEPRRVRAVAGLQGLEDRGVVVGVERAAGHVVQRLACAVLCGCDVDRYGRAGFIGRRDGPRRLCVGKWGVAAVIQTDRFDK